MTNITKAAQDAIDELDDLADLLSRFEAPIDSCVGASMTRATAAANSLRAALQDKAGEVREPVAYRVDYPGVDSIGLRRFFGADQWAASKGTVEFLGGVAVPLYAQPAQVLPDDVVRNAERYRWLRDPKNHAQIGVGQWTDDGFGWRYSDEADEVIDAAMLAAK